MRTVTGFAVAFCLLFVPGYLLAQQCGPWGCKPPSNTGSRRPSSSAGSHRSSTARGGHEGHSSRRPLLMRPFRATSGKHYTPRMFTDGVRRYVETQPSRRATRPSSRIPSGHHLPGTGTGTDAPAPPPIQLGGNDVEVAPLPPTEDEADDDSPTQNGGNEAHEEIQAKLVAIRGQLQNLATKKDVQNSHVFATITNESVKKLAQQIANQIDLTGIAPSNPAADGGISDGQWRTLLLEIQRNRNEIAGLGKRMTATESKQNVFYTKVNAIATTVQSNSGQLQHLIAAIGTVNKKLDAQDNRLDDVGTKIQNLDVRVQRYEKEQTNLVRRALASGGVKFRMTLRDDGEVELSPVEK